MNPKAKPVVVMLGLAAVMLLAGLWLLARYMSARAPEAPPPVATAAPETTMVLITKQDIPAQAALDPAMVEAQAAPLVFVPPDALTNAADVAGLYAKLPILKGEVLRRAKAVAREEALSLTYKVPAGMRAITIQTTEGKAVGYWINPGDRVDVIALFPQSERQPAGLSQTVLQDVQVLELTPPIAEEDKNRKSSVPTATLAVTLKQAELVALVESQAQLVLVLRGVDDRKVESTGGTTFSQVFGQTSFGREDSPAPPPPTTVEVFQNGQRISTPVTR